MGLPDDRAVPGQSAAIRAAIQKATCALTCMPLSTGKELAFPCLPLPLYLKSKLSIAQSGCVCCRRRRSRPASWRALPKPAGGSGITAWPSSFAGAAGKTTRLAPKPSISFLGLGREFTALRQRPEISWLQAYGHKEVKYTLKYLADAYQTFFQDPRAHPRFKARHRTTDGFTIPRHGAVADTHLQVPRIGWLRVKGSNPYAGGQAPAGPQPPGRHGHAAQVVRLPGLRGACHPGQAGALQEPWAWTATWGRPRTAKALCTQAQGIVPVPAHCRTIDQAAPQVQTHPGPRHPPHQPQIGRHGAYCGH